MHRKSNLKAAIVLNSAQERPSYADRKPHCGCVMGCNVSTYVRKDNINQCLEKNQIDLVKTTWLVLKQDMTGTGIFILSK